MPTDSRSAEQNATAAGADWRQALGRILPPSEGPELGEVDSVSEQASARGASAPTGLALQFQMRELLPRTTYRWNGPTSKAATRRVLEPSRERATDHDLTDRDQTDRDLMDRDPAEGSGEYRLGVRPVARTATGWARGTLTWTALPHLLHRLALDPDQHRLLCQVGALHRAATPPVAGQDPDWLFLDEFVNPVLWTLLDQATALRVPFVGAVAGATIRVAGAAVLRVDVTRTGAGGVRLRPQLQVEGMPVAVRRAQAIGTHGVILFDPEAPRDVTVAPVQEPLDTAGLVLLRSLGSDDSDVAVPPDGAEEFLRDHLPALREHVAVVSSDDSVPLPPPAPPTLVLTARFAPLHRLALDWRWESGRRSALPPRLADVLPPGVVPDEWRAAAGDHRGALPAAVELTGLAAAEFAATALPEIAALPGVRVDTDGTPPDYRELTGQPRLTISAVPTEQLDWFDLGVTVVVDGRTVPFTPLFRALAKGRTKILLADGRFLSLAHSAFAPLRVLIEEAADLSEWLTKPVISRYQISLWADFEDLADESQAAVRWRGLLREVRAGPAPLDPPRGLRAQLRPYQADGFAWLAFLWRHRLGGVLADDMGLGKTVQCLALVQHVREAVPAASTPSATDSDTANDNDSAADPDSASGPDPARPRRPFLVVAPTSVVSSWVAEAARFTPDLIVRSITATEAQGKRIADAAAGADIVVTSYALFRMDFDAIQTVARQGGFAGLILDEAQFVKNAASRAHECAVELQVPFKLAVTGTPMENSLTELHAVLAIVAPGLFPSARRFAEEYVRPIEGTRVGVVHGRGAGAAPEVGAQLRSERLARLRRRIRPFLLRRTKEQVAPELPAVQEQVLRIELAPAHRALYDVWLQRERRKVFGLLDDLDRHRFIVFRSLTLLRLLALDASLLGDAGADAPSSKLDALMEQLDELLAAGHRALVFSQFTSYLALAADRLNAAGVPYAYLDGGTRDRDAAIRAFQGGAAPVFLISLKAGGFGLNLTDADCVFLLDPWWNPAGEQQAIDRAHRIGQQKPVSVYRLVAADTIEEKVMALKERKSAVFDAVLDDEQLFGALLSADDVRGLLA